MNWWRDLFLDSTYTNVLLYKYLNRFTILTNNIIFIIKYSVWDADLFYHCARDFMAIMNEDECRMSMNEYGLVTI